MQIGFVGIGRMGREIARRLLEAGHEVTVHDSNPAEVSALTRLGAKSAASPAALASETATVFVCLPSPPVVREVALGPSGLVHGNAMKTYVDFSTTGPRTAVAVAEGLAERGVACMDATMGGGVAGAREGKLTLMVSGPREEFERLEPVLDHLCAKRFYVGAEPGMGQMLKLLNNFLSVTALTATSEAVVLGMKAGISPRTILDVLNACPARNNATEVKFPKNVLPRTFDHGFATELMYKDISLCLDEAETLGVPMWVGSAIRQVWAYAMSQGCALDDTTEIVKHYERWTGVEVKE